MFASIWTAILRGSSGSLELGLYRQLKVVSSSVTNVTLSDSTNKTSTASAPLFVPHFRRIPGKSVAQADCVSGTSVVFGIRSFALEAETEPLGRV